MLFVQTASADNSVYQSVDYRIDPAAREVLRLRGQTSTGIAVGDRVVVLADQDVVAAGAVSKIEAEGPRATLELLEWSLPERGQALVIPRSLPDRLDPWLPRFVIRQGPSDRASGAERGNDLTETGPNAAGQPTRVRVRVLAVDGQVNHCVIRLANPVSTRLGIGDRLDLYRGVRYVGFAKVVSIDGSTAAAEVVGSLSALAVQAGDLAVRRPPAGSRPVQRGFVFRVEGDYALVSLGEADGVRRGDRLFVRDSRGRDRRLTVERVYPDHCGAGLEVGGAEDAGGTDKASSIDEVGGLAVWQPVTLNEPGPALVELSAPVARPAGVSWLFRIPAGPQTKQVRQGDLVFWRGRPPRLGVVLTAGRWGAYVYVPGVWTVLDGKSVSDDEASAL